MQKRLSPVFLVLVACGPALGPATLARHPPIRLAPPGARVVAASQNAAPSWLSNTSSSTPGRRAFLGQGSAPTREAAEASARRDLIRSITEFLGVQVDYQQESISEHRSVGDQVEERALALEESRSRARQSQTIARGAQVAETYWEQVECGGPEPTFRVYQRAFVEDSLLEVARLEAHLAGERDRGRKVLSILELSGPDSSLAHGITAELRGRLSVLPGLSLTAELPAPLQPDLELRGRLEQLGPLLRVHYRLGSPAQSPPPPTRVVEGSRERLFELEDRLSQAVSAELKEQSQ